MSAGEITPQSLQFANAINEVANRDKITSSDTPRTDAFLENALSAIHETETIEDFTRQLERENAALRERADRNQEDAERYRSLIDATEINSDSFYWSRNEKAKSATIVAEMDAIFGITEE